MERRKPLTRSPMPRGRALDLRDGQLARSVKKATKPRRNDSAWRAECLHARGHFCRAGALGGCSGRIELDHIMPRAQGGPSVVENGLPMCSKHHAQKTNSEIKFDRSWFDDDQISWLAEVGWVRWLDDGSVAGRGMNHFAAALGRGGIHKEAGYGEK